MRTLFSTYNTIFGKRETAFINIVLRQKRYYENLLSNKIAKKGFVLKKEEIIDHCVKMLSKYKIPKAFEFVTSLPLSAAGKVLKRELIKRNKV